VSSRRPLQVALVLVMTVAVLFAAAAALADMLPEPVDPGQTVTATVTLPEAEPVQPEPAVDFLGLWYQIEFIVMPALVLLVFTILIETPIVVIAGRGAKASWQVGVLVNMLTNPTAVLIMLISFEAAWDTFAVMAAIEIAVAITECWVFMRVLNWSLRKALIVSLIANLASFVIGIVLASGF